ncbi:MAG: DUF4065 domain-containing protein [Methanomassiliicoccaceae archaeon]|nr:DUF4065 domain-containing protein [Methanomassiliicoccaceae archaeon]
MASASDVANFFIDINKNTEDPMTNLRLQKYLFFAQGWSLALFGRPLFEERIEAWQLGPVVPDVYRGFSSHGKDPIRSPREGYSSDVFTREEVDFLMDVAMEYYRYSTGGLVGLCHGAGGAWESVYDDSTPYKEIPTDRIKEEFSKKEALQRFDIDSISKNMKRIGYRDSEGYLVLPKEYDYGD